MINKSLAELSDGITSIVSENSFYGSPIYLERQIAPSCRHDFLNYFNFDKYDKKTSDERPTPLSTFMQFLWKIFRRVIAKT